MLDEIADEFFTSNEIPNRYLSDVHPGTMVMVLANSKIKDVEYAGKTMKYLEFEFYLPDREDDGMLTYSGELKPHDGGGFMIQRATKLGKVANIIMGNDPDAEFPAKISFKKFYGQKYMVEVQRKIKNGAVIKDKQGKDVMHIAAVLGFAEHTPTVPAPEPPKYVNSRTVKARLKELIGLGVDIDELEKAAKDIPPEMLQLSFKEMLADGEIRTDTNVLTGNKMVLPVMK